MKNTSNRIKLQVRGNKYIVTLYNYTNDEMSDIETSMTASMNAMHNKNKGFS